LAVDYPCVRIEAEVDHTPDRSAGSDKEGSSETNPPLVSGNTGIHHLNGPACIVDVRKETSA
jgi:hypothetical protein